MSNLVAKGRYLVGRAYFVVCICIVSLNITCTAQGKREVLEPVALTSLKRISTVQLVENDTAVITDVWSASLSPSRQFLAVSDLVQGKIFLYDAASGRLRKVFVGNRALTDTLRSNLARQDSTLILSSAKEMDEIIRKGSQPEMMMKMTQNTFENACFVSDSMMLLTGYLKGFVKKNKWGSIQGISRTSLMKYYIYEDCLDVKVLNPDNIHPDPSTYAIRYNQVSSQVSLSCENKEAAAKNAYDKTWTLSNYSIDGQHIKDLMLLPEECRTTRIGYNFTNPRIAFDDEGRLLATFTNVASVYTESSSFKLQELSATNDNFFQVARDNPSISSQVLGRLLTIRLISIETTARNSYVISGYKWDTLSRSSTWYVQEYQSNGKLLRNQEVAIDPKSLHADEKIQYMSYRKELNAFLVLSLSKQNGWFMSLYRWER